MSPTRVDREAENARTWSQVPDDLRRKVLARHADRGADVLATASRLRSHEIRWTAFGAVATLLLGVAIGEQSIFIRALMVGLSGANTFLIVRRRLGMLHGVVLYGGGTLVVSLFGIFGGGLELYYVIGMFAWLVLMVIGAAISLFAELERQRRLGPY